MPALRDFLPPIFHRDYRLAQRAYQQYQQQQQRMKDLITGSIGFEPSLAAWLSNPNEPSYLSAHSYEKLAEHGYGRNPYLHRAVRLIAEGAAGIPWRLYQRPTGGPGGKRKEVESDPLLDALNLSANEEQTGPELIEWFISYWLLAGMSYLYAVRPETPKTGPRPPTALYVLQPNLVTPKTDAQGMLEYWQYEEAGRKLRIAPEDLMRVKDFNPLNRTKGLASASVAARAVDQHNAANDWNTAMQQNYMRSPGILSPDTKDGVVMDATANENWRNQLHEKYSGPANAGKPLAPRFPVKWQSMGNSAIDMDWLAGKQQAAREISIPLGVPPVLLNDPDNTTYNNLKEAKMALYQEAILPRLDRLAPALGRFLLPMYGYDPRRYELGYDRDEIEALQEDRDNKHDRARKDYDSGVVSLNEARNIIGLDDVEHGEVMLAPRGAQTLDMLMEQAGLPAIPDASAGVPTPPALPAGNIVDANPANVPAHAPASDTPSGKAVMPPFTGVPTAKRDGPQARRRRANNGTRR